MESTKCPKCLSEMEFIKCLQNAGKDSQHYLPMTGTLAVTHIVVAQLYKCPNCDYKKTIFNTL